MLVQPEPRVSRNRQTSDANPTGEEWFHPKCLPWLGPRQLAVHGHLHHQIDEILA